MFSPFSRLRVYAPHDDEMMTKQSSKDECDIYKILKQYQRTGILTHIAAAPPVYGDLPDPIDYQEALNQVMAADQAFAALPASIRDEFRNEPAELLQALADPAKGDRLRELGILRPLPAADQAAPAPAAPKEA